MGQVITVTEKQSARQDMVRFELNRAISGMGHERYRAGQAVVGHRPVDELGRRLLAMPGVEAVHIYSNVVTVDLAPAATPAGMAGVIEDLFIHYRPGVLPSIPG